MQVQRDHGTAPLTPLAGLGRLCGHDGCDGLPKGNRRPDPGARLRLCLGAQGQSADPAPDRGGHLRRGPGPDPRALAAGRAADGYHAGQGPWPHPAPPLHGPQRSGPAGLSGSGGRLAGPPLGRGGGGGAPPGRRARRYYLSRLPPDAVLLAQAIREHWSVENRLHRVLDVHFREDASPVRVGDGARNFAVLWHRALNLTAPRGNRPRQPSLQALPGRAGARLSGAGVSRPRPRCCGRPFARCLTKQDAIALAVPAAVVGSSIL
jgi:hypothetical protein